MLRKRSLILFCFVLFCRPRITLTSLLGRLFHPSSLPPVGPTFCTRHAHRVVQVKEFLAEQVKQKDGTVKAAMMAKEAAEAQVRPPVVARFSCPTTPACDNRSAQVGILVDTGCP